MQDRKREQNRDRVARTGLGARTVLGLVRRLLMAGVHTAVVIGCLAPWALADDPPPEATASPERSAREGTLTWWPGDTLLPSRVADLRHPRPSLRYIGSPRNHRPQLNLGLGGQFTVARFTPGGGANWEIELELFS